MAIASITQWLNSPDKNYNHGKLLYEQYGESRVILALIRSGSGSYHFSKLHSALKALNELAEIQPKQIFIAPPPPDAKPLPGSKEAIDFKNAPDLIMELRTQKNLYYAEARKLFESLRFLDSQKHRLQAGLRILDLMDKVGEIWSIIDEWKEKGVVRQLEQEKQIAAVAGMSREQLLQEEKLLAPNVSKDKTKIAGCTNPQRLVKLTARYQERSLRLEEVRRRLNEPV